MTRKVGDPVVRPIEKGVGVFPEYGHIRFIKFGRLADTYFLDPVQKYSPMTVSSSIVKVMRKPTRKELEKYFNLNQ